MSRISCKQDVAVHAWAIPENCFALMQVIPRNCMALCRQQIRHWNVRK